LHRCLAAAIADWADVLMLVCCSAVALFIAVFCSVVESPTAHREAETAKAHRG